MLLTADDALATSAIVLKDGKTHGDLMAAQATATLVDGGTNTVTLEDHGVGSSDHFAYF